MIARLILTATVMCLSSPMFAGPYLVQFRGTVTEIDDVAPESFWIGEKVAGAFVYDPDAPASLTVVQQFGVVEPSIGSLPGWSDIYHRGFPQDNPILMSQIFQGGGLLVETESGFFARDEATDIHWVGSTTEGIVTITADGSSVFQLANNGRLANLLFNDEVVNSSLQTLSGPVAYGIELAFSTRQVEVAYDSDDNPSVRLNSLANPDNFPGLMNGSIVFATDPKDYGRTLSAGVIF